MTNMFIALKSTTCMTALRPTTVCKRYNTDIRKLRTKNPLAAVNDWQTIYIHGYWYYLIYEYVIKSWKWTT